MGFEIEEVKRFVELSEKEQQLKDQLKELKEEKDKLEEELMPEFEKAGIPKMTVDGRTIYIHRQLWAGYKEDKSQAIEALKNSGLDNYIYETYNTHSLSAYFRGLYKEYEEDNGFLEDPEEILSPDLKGKISLTEKMSLRTRKG